MKKNNLISIIVPIYNADKYLNNLLNSVNNQNFNNYEILLINDGSKDQSERICLNYLKVNSCAKYYKKENTGVSDTRNFGIEHANGKYICFVDADDILCENYLKDLITLLENNNSDMSCCDYAKFNDKIIECNDECKKVVTYENNSKYDLIYDKYGGYLWNKLFIRSIIIDNNIKFNDDIGMCEDMLFVFEYLKYVNKISCTNNKNYNYRIIKSSASKNIKNIKWFSIFKTLDKIIENKDLYSATTYNSVIYSYIFYLYEAKYRLKFNKNIKEYKKIKLDIKNRIKNIRKLKNIKFTLKQNFKIFIYKYFNTIAFKIKKRRDNNI